MVLGWEGWWVMAGYTVFITGRNRYFLPTCSSLSFSIQEYYNDDLCLVCINESYIGFSVAFLNQARHFIPMVIANIVHMLALLINNLRLGEVISLLLFLT